MAKWSPKDPNDIRDYYFDWTEFLPDPTTTIVTSAVTVPSGITKVTDDFSGKFSRWRSSGGTALSNYDIDCLITVSTGEQFEQTKTLQVKERKKP